MPTNTRLRHTDLNQKRSLMPSKKNRAIPDKQTYDQSTQPTEEQMLEILADIALIELLKGCVHRNTPESKRLVQKVV
jgi:hypothetical protein